MYLSTSRGPSRIAAVTQANTDYGLPLTSPGAINTKSAWTQLYSSAPFATQGVLLNIRAADFGTKYLVDIGIGGAGSEEVIIPDLFLWMNNSTPSMGVYIPIRIPAGVRVSARVAMSTLAGSATVGVQLLLIAEDLQWDRVPRIPRATAFGVDAANSRGVTLTSAGGGAKGAWVELTASTPHPVHWLVIQFGSEDRGSGMSGDYDIAIGGAGSEKIILPDFGYAVAAPGGDHVYPPYTALPVFIPPGSRLAARFAGSLSGNLELVVLGVGT